MSDPNPNAYQCVPVTIQGQTIYQYLPPPPPIQFVFAINVSTECDVFRSQQDARDIANKLQVGFKDIPMNFKTSWDALVPEQDEDQV